MVENKPEAPWIKRTNKGIVFTDYLQENSEMEVDNLRDLLKNTNLSGILFLYYILNEIDNEILKLE